MAISLFSIIEGKSRGLQIILPNGMSPTLLGIEVFGGKHTKSKVGGGSCLLVGSLQASLPFPFAEIRTVGASLVTIAYGAKGAKVVDLVTKEAI
ncbi:unnamed protein product [Cuscuta campestris]|uniref:Uncharacterized protein n=1 Tax=Cuscuta campestris TaxID=132261 RepID=A0A484MPZ9_9ASTE|nr:unnamed protein product [Cuscuta campestris]